MDLYKMTIAFLHRLQDLRSKKNFNQLFDTQQETTR